MPQPAALRASESLARTETNFGAPTEASESSGASSTDSDELSSEYEMGPMYDALAGGSFAATSDGAMPQLRQDRFSFGSSTGGAVGRKGKQASDSDLEWLESAPAAASTTNADAVKAGKSKPSAGKYLTSGLRKVFRRHTAGDEAVTFAADTERPSRGDSNELAAQGDSTAPLWSQSDIAAASSPPPPGPVMLAHSGTHHQAQSAGQLAESGTSANGAELPAARVAAAPVTPFAQVATEGGLDEAMAEQADAADAAAAAAHVSAISISGAHGVQAADARQRSLPRLQQPVVSIADTVPESRAFVPVADLVHSDDADLTSATAVNAAIMAQPTLLRQAVASLAHSPTAGGPLARTSACAVSPGNSGGSSRGSSPRVGDWAAGASPRSSRRSRRVASINNLYRMDSTHSAYDLARPSLPPSARDTIAMAGTADGNNRSSRAASVSGPSELAADVASPTSNATPKAQAADVPWSRLVAHSHRQLHVQQLAGAQQASRADSGKADGDASDGVNSPLKRGAAGVPSAQRPPGMLASVPGDDRVFEVCSKGVCCCGPAAAAALARSLHCNTVCCCTLAQANLLCNGRGLHFVRTMSSVNDMASSKGSWTVAGAQLLGRHAGRPGERQRLHLHHRLEHAP